MSPTYVGGKSFAVIRRETVYGDGGTVADKMTLATNSSNPTKNNFLKIYALGGGRDYFQSVPGRFECSGTLEFEVQNGFPLQYFFGSVDAGSLTTTSLDGVAITGTTTGLRRYRVMQTNVIPSFSIDQYEISVLDVDQLIKYYGCKVNQLVLKADTENPLHATFDWIGQTGSIVKNASLDAIAGSLLSYNDPVFMFYRGTVNIGASVAETTGSLLGGTVISVVNNAEITSTNNVEPYFAISSTTARGTQFLIEKFREYSIRFNMNFTSSDMISRFYNGTTTATQPLTNTDYNTFNMILDYRKALSDNDYTQLRVVLREMYFDELSVPVNPKDIVTQDITAHCKRADVYYITKEVQ